MIDTCELLTGQLGALYSCQEQNGYMRIRTPFLYPDGDVIDLFVREEDGVLTITDLGETARWLRMNSLSRTRSDKQRRLIEDICLNHGIEFFKGALTARVRSQEELAGVVTRLAQAALRAGDLWFTFRTRSVQTLTDEVADFLTERHIAHQRTEKISGRSGRIWTPDFHTRHPNRSALIYVLSTGSRAAARNVAEHVLAAWYDLHPLTVGPESLKFVSLFDDTQDVWAQEDFRLVEDLSEVLFWSNPDMIERALAA